MIRMKPTLLVSDGCYSLLPLHLAAAYGHINVLEIILKVKLKFELFKKIFCLRILF